MVARSISRVHQNTAEAVNDRIRMQTEMRINYYRSHPDEIGARLAELAREWDIERTLELLSSGLSLAGLLLGAFGKKRGVLLALVVQGFFLQHAIQGWCPPLPLLRRVGFRTQAEIERERHALRALRGDYHGQFN